MFVCENQLAASACYLRSMISVNASTFFPEIFTESLSTVVLSVTYGSLSPLIFFNFRQIKHILLIWYSFPCEIISISLIENLILKTYFFCFQENFRFHIRLLKKYFSNLSQIFLMLNFDLFGSTFGYSKNFWKIRNFLRRSTWLVCSRAKKNSFACPSWRIFTKVLGTGPLSIRGKGLFIIKNIIFHVIISSVVSGKKMRSPCLVFDCSLNSMWFNDVMMIKGYIGLLKHILFYNW